MEGITETESREGVFLVDAKRGRLYGLEASGRAVWNSLGESIRVDDLCHRLATEFSGDEETIRRDVTELLEMLLQSKLIKVNTGIQ